MFWTRVPIVWKKNRKQKIYKKLREKQILKFTHKSSLIRPVRQPQYFTFLSTSKEVSMELNFRSWKKNYFHGNFHENQASMEVDRKSEVMWWAQFTRKCLHQNFYTSRMRVFINQLAVRPRLRPWHWPCAANCSEVTARYVRTSSAYDWYWRTYLLHLSTAVPTAEHTYLLHLQ